MNPKSFRFFLLVVVGLAWSDVFLRAQTSAPSATATLAPAATFEAAHALRHSQVVGVVQGTLTPAAIIAQLKATASPTGINYSSAAADFAYGAIDVGQRLLTVGKHAEAVALFQAAEISLALLVATTPDSKAQDKAQYLQSLALIRGRYLNKLIQAKGDITQALVLQPGELTLLGVRNQLASEHPELFAPAN